MEETCETCKFFKPSNPGYSSFALRGGICRRHAPQGPIVIPGRNSLDSTWQPFPPVNPDDWCGEYHLTITPSEPHV